MSPKNLKKIDDLIKEIKNLRVPEFPLTGEYLINKGFKSGRKIGEILKKVEKVWIENFFKYKLGIDGISVLFIVLTSFITQICVISCINSIKLRIKEFLIALLVLETFMLGVFCSLDLLLFYLFCLVILFIPK